MHVDQKGLGKPPVFSGKEEDFYVWAKKVESYVSGALRDVRGALSFAVESLDVVTAAAVALGVPELDDVTSTEVDGQLFIVLSAITDGEWRPRLRELAQVAQQVGPVHGGTCT